MLESYAKVLSNIARNVHEKLLKPVGFKKKGNTFNRNTTDGLIQVVNFQAGRYEPFAVDIPGFHYPNALYGWFTINLGVFVPEYTLRKENALFTYEVDCALRSRIGELRETDDLWFKIDSIPEVERKVIELLLEYGIPFLEKFSSREKIISNIEEKHENRFMSPSLILLAKIHYHEGRKTKAQALLRKQYDETKKDVHKKYVYSLAETMGIPISDNEQLL